MDEILLDDQREERDENFATRLGVERWFYLQAIGAAVNHSVNTAVADPNLRPWRTWGARNIGGRIRSLVQHPRNPSVLYAGSAQGGVFKSTDGGDTWQQIGLPKDSFPVGAMAIAPNSQTLYVGSGEPAVIHDQGVPAGAPTAVQAREVAAAGLGFFRYDELAGTFTQERVPLVATPAPVGAALLGAADSYAQIVVDPAHEPRCWLASHTGLWRRESAANFVREPIPAPPGPVAPTLGACASDVVIVPNFDPDHPTHHRLYAALPGVGIFRGVFNPNPAGTVWEQLTRGLPVAAPTLAVGASFMSFDRIKIAVCKSFPQHVYAVYEQGSTHGILNIFHSSDAGTNWAPCVSIPPNLGTQAWSNLCIAVHPDNPDIVIVGNVNLARTTDAGRTWDPIIDWSNFTGSERAEHGDEHFLCFDLLEPNRLWVGNDGGISTAPDVVNVNPRTARTWRKRSHALCISQFNDITSHPTYPFMLGGGLQDNATFITFGGPTWMLVGDADGGQMSFEIRNARRYMAPNQGSAANPRCLNQANVVAGSGMDPVPGSYPINIRSQVNADLSQIPNDIFATLLTLPAAASNAVMIAVRQPFVPVLLHHRSDPNQLLAGRIGDLIFSTDGGSNWTRANCPAAGGETVNALAYGLGATAPPADWWGGTNRGRVFLGTGAAPPKAWATVFPPAGFVMRSTITSIAVHPNNNNYIAIATGGTSGAAANPQGQVFLSNDHGAHWLDITGIGPAFDVTTAAPGAPLPPPLNRLPPCPVTSLAFDPSVAAGNPQILFAGTLGGVYVIRNLPPLPVGPPPPIPVPAPFNPDWRSFNGTATAPLPLTLVNDLELLTLPARPGAAANSAESVNQLRLYAAMYGRGIFVCDVTPAAVLPAVIPPGGRPVRLFIRQHVVEDGLAYPRITPVVLNTAPTAAANYNQPELDGDPRLPVGPAVGENRFNDISGYDIRIDNEPFQFFDEVLDGVEFDEELKTKSVVPGQLNAIYVQVHTAGWDRADAVDVHLFFAQAPAPAAGADPNPLPDLQADFWSHFTEEPALAAPAAAPVAPRAFWQRVGPKKVIPANRLTPTSPVVLRFEWVPPSSLGAGFVGLLAVCTSTADPLPAVATISTNLRALVRAERRVAFRLVPSTAYTPDVYIRDTLEDDGRPGAGGAAGRSPDIIVVQSPAADPNTEFRDLLDLHAGDRIRVGVDQTIYVRVHNRRAVAVQADVEVLWAKPNAAVATPDAHAPTFDGTTWTRIAPTGTANLTVPANGWAFARLTWGRTDIPPIDTSEGAFNAVALIALVSSSEGVQDVKPIVARVRDAASFWQFFGRLADSNNAAMRALLIEP